MPILPQPVPNLTAPTTPAVRIPAPVPVPVFQSPRLLCRGIHPTVIPRRVFMVAGRLPAPVAVLPQPPAQRVIVRVLTFSHIYKDRATQYERTGRPTEGQLFPRGLR